MLKRYTSLKRGLRRLVCSYLFTLLLLPISGSAIERMVAIGNERFQFEHTSELHEIQTKETNIHLLLRHKDGFPTLNVITYGQKYSDSLTQQSEWLMNSYRAVGLIDSKVLSFKERQIGETKGFEGEILFTHGAEKRLSRVLILPYQDYQVVFTLMDQKSNSGLSRKLWEQLLRSLKAPSNALNLPPKENNTALLLIILSTVLAAVIALIVLRQKLGSQGPHQKQD